MLHILYGVDDFSIHEALERLKAQVGPLDVLDANVTRGHVSSFSPQQIQALCHTVPFLASKRLVIVDGLLSMFDGRRPSRRGRGNRDASSQWLSMTEYVPDMPPSTDLILLDGPIGRANAMLDRLSPLGPGQGVSGPQRRRAEPLDSGQGRGKGVRHIRRGREAAG